MAAERCGADRHQSRQNNLTAILNPGHRRNNTFVRDFVNINDLGGHFHDFGSDPKMQQVVDSRTELYLRLCRKIWEPERLGLPPAVQSEPEAAPERNEEALRVRRRPTPNPRTAVARLLKHGVLPNDVRIVAKGSEYQATVDGDGIIWLPTGDAFVSLDEAGKAVTGFEKCDGLEFWQVPQADGSLISLRVVRDKAQADGRLMPARRLRR